MKTILVPIDFSGTAFNALKYAVKFCLQVNGCLILFHSSDDKINRFNISDREISDLEIKLELDKKESLKKELEKACKEVNIPVDYITSRTVVSLDMFVLEDILDACKTFHPDIVIMGTHGASPLKRIFMGSNTSGMIERSEIPVLAIPQNYNFRIIKSIVYASDLKNLEAEFKVVEPFAIALNALLEVVYVDYGFLETDSESIFADFITKSNFKNAKFIDRKVTINSSVEVYLKKYLQHRNDCILTMFESDKSLFDKIFLSSKTESMAFDLPCPLMAMKKSKTLASK